MPASSRYHRLARSFRSIRPERWLLIALASSLATLLGGGCTHQQLTRNTALTATTVNSIQYRMVLDNIAMMSCEPANLPSHVRLADGTVQISNEAGFGESGGFSALQGMGFGFEQWGPAGSTKVSEQWGTDAVEDPIQVFALQTVYRKALGLEPLQEPNFILAGKKSRKENAPGQSSSDESSEGSGSSVSSVSIEDQGSSSSKQPETLPAPDASWMVASDQSENSAPGHNGKRDISADLDASEFDVPVGWFFVGCKEDVPVNACYVGRYRDRFAWVTSEGVSDLAKFTLAVLTITKLESSETKGRSGLMFTP